MTSEQFAARALSMKQKLFRVAYGLLRDPSDREDAVSEAIRKALVQREKLRDESKMEAWLMRILINECHTIGRKKARELPVERVPERAAPAGANPELHDAILALPVDLRTAVILHYMDGYPLEMIAEMTRAPLNTVKTRLLRARRQLRVALTEEDQAL